MSLFDKIKNWLSPRSPSPMDDIVALRQGLAAEAENDPGKAMLFYQQAVEQNPGNAYAHQMLASHYAEQGNHKAAIDQYRKALDLVVKDNEVKLTALPICIGSPSMLFDCAIKYAHERKDPAVLEELLDKNYDRFSIDDGEMLRAFAHFKAGMIHYERAGQAPDADAVRSACSKALKHFLDSRKSQKEWQEVNGKPFDVEQLPREGRKYIGYCQLLLGNFDDAMRELYVALEHSSPEEQTGVVHEALGICHEHRKEYEAAMRHRLQADGLM